MNTIGTWTGRAASVTALSTAAVLGFAGLAHADNIQDTIDDSGAGVTLSAGSGVSGQAGIRLVANGNDGGTRLPGCNVTDPDIPLTVKFVDLPTGVTVNDGGAVKDGHLSITECGVDHTVSFAAGEAAQSGGTVTVQYVSGPGGAGAYHNLVKIPITVTQPANTTPSVAVKGVTDGATYEIGAVPTVTCEATDKEDGPSSPVPSVTGNLSHGLGTQTVSCETTDSKGLKATASATYRIVDTGDPTIEYALSSKSPANAGWYKDDVTVDFTCADSGSGIQSCTDDVTRGEGEHDPMTGTATDWSGNTATVDVPGFKVDKTAPTEIQFTGGPTDRSEHYYGDVPVAPAGCTATDPLSGVASCTVAGGGTAVGTHTYTATATDVAGNTAQSVRTYVVKSWDVKGFYAPVDLGGVLNTVKAGSTVPLKFEVFAGVAEKTAASAVRSFETKQVSCSTTSVVDEVELTTTGGTSLRYDAAGGQFVQNWQTPKTPGVCVQATITTQDGSTTSALFKLK